MAESTPLGNLDVLISADWSDLQTAIDAAVQASETGAAAIQAAFDGVDVGDNIVASLGFISGAAQQASSDLSGFGEAVQGSVDQTEALGDAGQSLGSGLGSVGDAAVSAS